MSALAKTANSVIFAKPKNALSTSPDCLLMLSIAFACLPTLSTNIKDVRGAVHGITQKVSEVRASDSEGGTILEVTTG